MEPHATWKPAGAVPAHKCWAWRSQARTRNIHNLEATRGRGRLCGAAGPTGWPWRVLDCQRDCPLLAFVLFLGIGDWAFKRCKWYESNFASKAGFRWLPFVPLLLPRLEAWGSAASREIPLHAACCEIMIPFPADALKSRERSFRRAGFVSYCESSQHISM